MAKRDALSDDERRELEAYRAREQAHRDRSRRSMRVLRQQRTALRNAKPVAQPTPEISTSAHVRARARAAPDEVTTIEKDSPVRAVAPVPKPNRYGDVIDAIRALGLEYEPNKKDGNAVKASTLAPARIAECYAAIARHTWGRDFNWDNLSVQHAIACWNAYSASKQSGVKRRPLMINGAAVPAAAMQANPNPDAELPDWDDEQARRSDEARARVRDALPARLRAKSRWSSAG